MLLRVYNPEQAVVVQAKQSVENTYNILKEAFALDFPEIPDSEKFSRSVMVRIKQGEEWATNTVFLPVVKDKELVGLISEKNFLDISSSLISRMHD